MVALIVIGSLLGYFIGGVLTCKGWCMISEDYRSDVVMGFWWSPLPFMTFLLFPFFAIALAFYGTYLLGDKYLNFSLVDFLTGEWRERPVIKNERPRDVIENHDFEEEMR